MVRDESERNHEHGLLTGRSDLFQDFLKRRSEPCLVSSARTLPRHPSSERRQSTEHEGHRLGQFPFIRSPPSMSFFGRLWAVNTTTGSWKLLCARSSRPSRTFAANMPISAGSVFQLSTYATSGRRPTVESAAPPAVQTAPPLLRGCNAVT